MGKQVLISNNELMDLTIDISSMVSKKINTDIIIGIARGGLYLAQNLGYTLELPVTSISIQLRDSNRSTKLIKEDLNSLFDSYVNSDRYQNQDQFTILFTDDLIDTGDTVNLIIEIYQEYISKNKNTKLKIAFAVFYSSVSHKEFIREAKDLNKINNDVTFIYGDLKPDGWLMFPWDILVQRFENLKNICVY
jgi:hypoxanthine phosphoribosyltransferase